MTKGELLVGEAVLCALYLRGSPYRVINDRRAWPRVVDLLLRERPVLGEAASVLRRYGRCAESVCLTPASLDWGIDIVARGSAFTFLDASYPRGWVNALGSGAPPCAWIRGTLPVAPSVAVVGSRFPTTDDLSFVYECGQYLMLSGCALVSGGAVGVDTAAVVSSCAVGGSERCVIVLPFGINFFPEVDRGCLISVCEPDTRFTTGQAMERNALVYSFGRKAVVVRPRFRQGGTWHGAVDALRRRLASVWILDVPQDTASKALVALGANCLGGANDLPLVVGATSDPGHPDLFGSAFVRESNSYGQYTSA